MQLKLFTGFDRNSGKRLLFLSLFLVTLGMGVYFTMIIMPGKSYQGELPPLTPEELVLKDDLQWDVEVLAGKIGFRNYQYYEGLQQSVDFFTKKLTQSQYNVQYQNYEIDGQVFTNIEVEIRGQEKPDEIIVVGGHYDSVYSSPGANDNGSGAAATLELARRFAQKKPARTLRFVEFINEEPPFFWTENMGSFVYAKRCQERGENIVGMLSLETMGYFSDAIGSQQYPINLLGKIYPLQGNFISFVGNLKSGNFLRKVVGSFRHHAQFPSEGAALPGNVAGVGWSDHWAFWQMGYPAVMVTDTAPFRYPYYHTELDTPEQLDYDRFTRVVSGLEKVITELANPS